jgi:iron complex outermembrane receptor protein
LQRLNQLAAIQGEAFFPNRVTRAAPTAADIAAGRPGKLLALDVTNINAGSLDTNGFDVQLSGNWKTGWGNFSPSLAATQVTRYQAADFPGSAIVDRLASANTQGSIPRLRATFTAPWSIAGYGLAPTVRYISAYDDVNQLNVKPGRSVPSQVLLDLQGTLDFQRAFGDMPWSKGLTLRVGALNLLNKEPPFALVGGQQGYDPTQGDLRERFVYGSIQKNF